MFGLVVEVAIAQGRDAEAEQMLAEGVVPVVRAMPGFVTGYWLQSDDGRTGLSMIIFDSEDSARAAASTAPQPPEGSGVTVKRFEPMRIAAQA